MENNNVEIKNSHKVLISMLAFILVVAVILGVLFGFGVLNASNGKKFVELLGENQKIFDLNLFTNEDGEIDSKFEIDLKGISMALGEDEVNYGTVTIESKGVAKNNDLSVTSVVKSDRLDANLELQVAKKGNLLGVNVPEITEKFIGVDLEDKEGLIRNLKNLGATIENEEASGEQKDKLLDMFYRYSNVLAENINDFVNKEPNKEFSIDGRSLQATEYSLLINDESSLKILLALEKELMANDEDIDFLVELGFIENKESFITNMQNDITSNENKVANNSFEGFLGTEILVKVYEKGGKNVATVVEAENNNFGLYVFENSKDNHDIVFSMKNNKEESLMIVANIIKNENMVNGEVKMNINFEDKKADVNILKFETIHKNEVTSEILDLNQDDILLLNTANEEELNKYIDNASDNAQKFIMKIIFGALVIEGNDEVPENILSNETEMLQSGEEGK